MYDVCSVCMFVYYVHLLNPYMYVYVCMYVCAQQEVLNDKDSVSKRLAGEEILIEKARAQLHDILQKAQVYLHTHFHTYIHTHIYSFIHIYIFIYTYINIHTSLYIHIHTYIFHITCKCMHAYIHTYIHRC